MCSSPGPLPQAHSDKDDDGDVPRPALQDIHGAAIEDTYFREVSEQVGILHSKA